MDRAPESVEVFYQDSTLTARNEIKGPGAIMCLNYKTKKDEVVNVKIGLSYTSIENAKVNLESEAKDLTFDEAMKDQTVSMICSGDAGVYGMAGLMYEIGANYPEVELEVVAGVTAATGGAAVLGAPLIHDFCLISLSDLLTPWEKIEKRLLLASEADFVIVLYNPSSHKRHDYLKKACELMLQHKSPETVCGTVKNINREGETARVMTLAELKETQVDMFTTVFIGNSTTRRIGDKMVTQRGYRIKNQEGNRV